MKHAQKRCSEWFTQATGWLQPATNWLRRLGFKDAALRYAEALYANDYGASLAALGTGELWLESQQWSDGEHHHMLWQPLDKVVWRCCGRA